MSVKQGMLTTMSSKTLSTASFARSISRISLLIYWLYLTISSTIHFPGSPILFLVFSFLYLVMLISAVHYPKSYAYTFLSLLLWLGFWLKITCHFTYDVEFAEPIGNFTGSSSEWNQVILIALLSCAAIMASDRIFSLLTRLLHPRPIFGDSIRQRIASNSSLHFISFLFLTILTLFINEKYRIFVLGFKVNTHLVWPLNGLITILLIGGGFSIWGSSILWWKILANKEIFSTVIVFIIIGALISVSTLSRGIVVFFSGPMLYSLFAHDSFYRLSQRKILSISIIFILTVFLTNVQVNRLRYQYEHPTCVYCDTAKIYDQRSNKSTFIKSDKHFLLPSYSQVVSLYVPRFLDFSIKRWIGAEGVMAVSTYQDRSINFFLKAFMERPVQGAASIYSQIAPWPVQTSDLIPKDRVVSFSLPGGIGFLCYSGSLVFVFLSVAFICLILELIEYTCFLITGNPILCSVVSLLFASNFVHLGGAPLYQVPMFLYVLSQVFLLSRFSPPVVNKDSLTSLWLRNYVRYT